jgi:hypothetical protein
VYLPHQFRSSTGRLFADLKVLNDRIGVDGILQILRAAPQFGEHGRGGHNICFIDHQLVDGQLSLLVLNCNGRSVSPFHK